MASTNPFLTLYSTVQTDSIGSTISTGFIPYISTAGRQAYRNMLSLGLSTNQTYNNLSNGTYSNWINAASSLGLSTIRDVAMSSTGQYQLIVVGSSTTLYLSSNSGVSWSALGSSNGLPAVATAYTYGAISANGQYMLVCANAGSVYVSSNYGLTFTNASLPSVGPTNWFAFENNTTDSAGSITPTITGTMYYMPGKVGNFALSIVNPIGGTAVNYLRGSWAPPTNCSIAFWVCPQSLPGTNQAIFSAYSGSILFWINTSNQFSTYFPVTSGAVGTITVTSFTPTANTWYHITLIYQTFGACSLYINGVLQGTLNNTSGFAGFGNTGLFGIGTYDHLTVQAYNGFIDDFRLYNYAIVPSGAANQNFNYAAISSTGQYMAVTAPGTLAYSSNYGQTWRTPYGLTTAGQMSGLAISNTGQYMLAQNGASIVPQPVAAQGISSNNWTVNGVSWQASASSNLNGNYPAYAPFNNYYSSAVVYSWVSATGTYNTSTGAYAGSLSTTVIGLTPTNSSGEWIQIQSSVPLVMNSYAGACGGTTNYMKTYVIAGSNDGVTWYALQSCTLNSNPFNGNFTLAIPYITVNYTGTQNVYSGLAASISTTSYSYSTNAYTYFRLITNTVQPASGGYVEINEWFINFSGGTTYSTNYGTTWTTTGTLASILASPCATSGNGQYTLTSTGSTGQTALINSNYVASPYAPGNGCVAYYPFNDAAGSTSITEAIGSYYNTTISGTVTFGSAGKVGTSAYFNSPSYLLLPSTIWPAWTTLSSGSIACWINPASASLTASPFFTKYISGNTYYSMLSIGSYSNGSSALIAGTPGKLYFNMSNTQLSAACSSNTILVANTWYHVVVTFNGTAVQFYINGVLDNTFLCNWTMANTPTNMLIGAGPANFYTGFMDAFSLWNIALSQSTITALYTSQSPTLTSINSAIVGTALSYTGQYQVLVTGGATNNVYYSTNYGQTFTNITVGSSLTLLGCTTSYDGSYITVYTASTVYILNNNNSGNSVAIGYAAGNTNQSANAISFGSYAGLMNQVANSIVLNATGSTMNATSTGLFVGPIQPYTATNVSSISLLGYGADNQVVTMGPSLLSITGLGALTVGNFAAIIPGMTFILPGSSSVATPFFLPIGGMYMVSTHTLGNIVGGANNAQWYAVSVIDNNSPLFAGALNFNISTNNATISCSATGQITVTTPGGTAFVGLQWSISAIRLC